jgi:hypothetical protein
LNVTVPLGEGSPKPGFVEVTVAVNVTDCPKFDGFGEEVSDVVVATLLTTWVKGPEPERT